MHRQYYLWPHVLDPGYYSIQFLFLSQLQPPNKFLFVLTFKPLWGGALNKVHIKHHSSTHLPVSHQQWCVQEQYSKVTLSESPRLLVFGLFYNLSLFVGTGFQVSYITTRVQSILMMFWLRPSYSLPKRNYCVLLDSTNIVRTYQLKVYLDRT